MYIFFHTAYMYRHIHIYIYTYIYIYIFVFMHMSMYVGSVMNVFVTTPENKAEPPSRGWNSGP